MKNLLYDIKLEAQPTETSCGPTCLHGIYQYYGHANSLSEIVSKVQYIKTGGTLGVHLGIDALLKGFSVTTYTHNLNVFDPSWFNLSNELLIEKLSAQKAVKKEAKLAEACDYYCEYLTLGGTILFEHLTPLFLHDLLLQEGPVICGLSSTYLYLSKREINDTCEYDDIYGHPQGHFVVLGGIKKDLSEVTVFDPYKKNPIQQTIRYNVNSQHFINSILIGVITYDANIIVIKPKESKNA